MYIYKCGYACTYLWRLQDNLGDSQEMPTLCVGDRVLYLARESPPGPASCCLPNTQYSHTWLLLCVLEMELRSESMYDKYFVD